MTTRLDVAVRGLFATPVAAVDVPDAERRNRALAEIILKRRQEGPLVISQTPSASYDLAIIGGGINGCGIARDAAGRGWSTYLCDKGDLGSGTSSASTKLVHGGLRYLEYFEFRLVREALIEREILWRIAPHIIRPLRFILPHHQGLRPAWLLRAGLFLYDHLGGRRRLPSTRTVTLASHPAGGPLKPSFKHGFEYSDCWVEDARLTVLNARDAADRGAVIAPRTRCINARAEGDHWILTVQNQSSGESQDIRARALVNAAGPWAGDVLRSVLKVETPTNVRLVKGSHIVLRRLYQHDYCYIFQNADRRILFVIPFETDFSLVGTTDLDYHGDPAEVGASPDEIDYLCRAASEYLRTPISPDMVVWSYSGVRPLYDDGASEAQAATRDYVLNLEAAPGTPALLTIYGGKITTYRRLAVAALEQLGPHLPQVSGRRAGWTGDEPLPGGDFPVDGFDALVAQTRARHPFLSERTLLRLVRTYGTRIEAVLGGASSMDDLGRVLGGDLTEAELRYLADAEWATTAADVVWRRTKLGLRLSAEEIAAVDQYLRALAASRIAAE